VSATLVDVIRSQYLASLAMLRQAIERCPDELWTAESPTNPFWHVAYHALFYTDLYLQRSEADFVAWPKHRQEYQFMGQLPWPPHHAPKIEQPYSRADVLEYLDRCRQEVVARLPELDMSAPSGFAWLPFGKLELQLYSIRHVQLHVGELAERLGAQAGVDVGWVGQSDG
jgi:DinB superfamily